MFSFATDHFRVPMRLNYQNSGSNESKTFFPRPFCKTGTNPRINGKRNRKFSKKGVSVFACGRHIQWTDHYRVNRMRLNVWIPILIVYMLPTICPGQGTPVQWQFTAENIEKTEVNIVLTANVAPGWHLYSQNIAEGGPLPTRITIDPSGDFTRVGPLQEKGASVTYHDKTYEMEITWYSGSVSFIQRIALKEPVATVTGAIEYMACNSYSCVPDKLSFKIEVRSPK
jgi:hypothetical protein